MNKGNEKFEFEGFIIEVDRNWLTVPGALLRKLQNDPRFVDLMESCEYFAMLGSGPGWGTSGWGTNSSRENFECNLSIETNPLYRGIRPRAQFLARLKEEYR